MLVRRPECQDRYIGPRIKSLNHALNRKIMETARANGLDELTTMHGRILGYLYWNPDRDVFQKDIEETFNITRSSVAGLVKLMEQKGYILRQSVQGDARLKKLCLTELGLRAVLPGLSAGGGPGHPGADPRAGENLFLHLRHDPSQSNFPKGVCPC